MLLLIVFILAYGVSSQAIIDPYREFKLENFGPLLFNIFFLPYWQMYGELQLERYIMILPKVGYSGVLNDSQVGFRYLIKVLYAYVCALQIQKLS